MQKTNDLKNILKYKNNKNITIFGSARIKSKEVENLCFNLSKSGFNIITGSGGGVMESANKGGKLGGAKINIGINIKLPFEQNPNKFCDEIFCFNDLSLRKKALIDLSDKFIIADGGFGTLDELFEIITLSQTKLKKSPKIILLNINGFWDKLLGFLNDLYEKKLCEKGVFFVANTIKEAFDLLVCDENLKNFDKEFNNKNIYEKNEKNSQKTIEICEKTSKNNKTTEEILFENDIIFIQKHESSLPWVKVFSKTPFKEFSDCDETSKTEILHYVLECEKAMRKFYNADKINIASFGNELPRVHFHIIARFKNDEFFPNSPWGEKKRESDLMLPDFDDFKVFLSDFLKRF